MTTVSRLDDLPAALPAGSRDVSICGGAQIYALTLPHWSDLYLTLVKREVQGDAFFPPFEEQFEPPEQLAENSDFKILHYTRRPAGAAPQADAVSSV